MRVWIARTQPGAERLAKTLTAHGHDAFTAPVLDIERVPSQPPAGRFDWVVFVSEHAAAEGLANGCLHASWRDCPWATIGAAAERLLRRHGVAPSMAPASSAKDLIEKLPRAPKRMLIVKGEGGSDVLQRWLREGGGKAAEWNVYRRRPLAPKIAGEGIDAIAIGSGEGLRVVQRLWFDDGRTADVPLLAPSSRVGDLAARLGFRNVVVTLGANADAVLEGLRTVAKSREQSRGRAKECAGGVRERSRTDGSAESA